MTMIFVSNIWVIFLNKLNPLGVLFPCHDTNEWLDTGIVPALVSVFPAALSPPPSKQKTEALWECLHDTIWFQRLFSLTEMHWTDGVDFTKQLRSTSEPADFPKYSDSETSSFCLVVQTCTVNGHAMNDVIFWMTHIQPVPLSPLCAWYHQFHVVTVRFNIDLRFYLWDGEM